MSDSLFSSGLFKDDSDPDVKTDENRECKYCKEIKPEPCYRHGRSACKWCERILRVARHSNQMAEKYERQSRLGDKSLGRLRYDDVLDALRESEGRDFWTARKLKSDWQIDHKEPLGRLGRNSRDNICICSEKTNRRKGFKSQLVWLGELARVGIRHDLMPQDMPFQDRTKKLL